MENSKKMQTSTTPATKPNFTRTNTIIGLNNWALVFLAIFCSNAVIDNYLSYGIIKTPTELTYDFIEFVRENWWCYAVLLLGYFSQILLCFLNEKLLAVGFLPEQLGMVLHVCISSLLFNVCAILCLVYKLHPVAGVATMGHMFLAGVKLWSYAYKNKKAREDYRKNVAPPNLDVSGKLHSKDPEIRYPQNVTLRNTFEFMVCTGTGIYKISGQSRKPANFKKVFAGISGTVFIYYTAAFLIYQYVFPEANKAILYINTGQYLNLFGSVLKLALPVNVVWVLYFYVYFFWLYLPLFGWFWGTEDIVTGLDWWNSENTAVFWTKWNYQVHIWLKECFFLPTLQMGYSKRTAVIVVGCVSGILHEYLICIPCRCCYGLALFVMLAQIPLANVTGFVQKKLGSKWGNLSVWMSLIFGHSVCLIFVYYNYLKSE